MKIAIQQPEHAPWLGFFHKMANCDTYIFLDNVQFKKRYFENRNKILTAHGPQWLTVPVISKGRLFQKINEVAVDNSFNWRRKYVESIRSAYGTTPFFPSFFPLIEQTILKEHERLVTLNLDLIDCIKGYFKLKTKCFLASEVIDKELSGSDLILEICKAKQASHYISGPDGRNYLALDKFQQAGIRVTFHEYQHPIYKQKHVTEFISHLSTLDYIFNQGCIAFI